MMNEDLRKWFGKGGEGGVGGGGWDRYNTKGERIGKCAREPGEPKPKCLSKEKAAKMSKGEIASAVRRKRKKDPVADRPGKGGEPIMSSNKIDEQSAQQYQKFDRRVNAAMAAKNPELKVKLLKLAGQAHPVKTAEEFMEACWKGYKQVGMKKKGKRMVPNCVPEEAELDEMITLAAPIVKAVSAASRVGQGVAKAGQAVKSGAQAVKSGVKKVGSKIKDAAQSTPEDEPEKQPLGSKKVKTPDWKKNVEKAGETAKSAVRTTTSGLASMYAPREEYIMEKNVPTNPSLWSRAKAQARAKFDVYPSAYANGWAAKWYKSKGGGWKKSAKESYDETRELLSFSNFRKISTDCRTDEAIDASRYGKTPDQLLQDIVNKNKLGGQVIKTNPQKTKVSEAVAAWQRKAGKNKEGGLNEKGRKSYERENPGSDLKAPVTTPPSKLDPDSKAAKRRKSFCARMGGNPGPMKDEKGRPTRKALSLRKWNC